LSDSKGTGEKTGSSPWISDTHASTLSLRLFSPVRKEALEFLAVTSRELKKKLPTEEEIEAIRSAWIAYAEEKGLTTLSMAIKTSRITTNHEKMVIEVLSPFEQGQILNHLQQLQRVVNERFHFFVPIQVVVKQEEQSQKMKRRDSLLTREALLRRMMEKNSALRLLVESGKFRLL